MKNIYIIRVVVDEVQERIIALELAHNTDEFKSIRELTEGEFDLLNELVWCLICESEKRHDDILDDVIGGE